MNNVNLNNKIYDSVNTAILLSVRIRVYKNYFHSHVFALINNRLHDNSLSVFFMTEIVRYTVQYLHVVNINILKHCEISPFDLYA